FRPVRAQKMRDVIVFFPIRGGLGINRSTIPIEKRHGTSVFAPRAKNPLKGRQLTAIFPQHMLLMSQISLSVAPCSRARSMSFAVTYFPPFCTLPAMANRALILAE